MHRARSWAPLCGNTVVGALPMPDVPPITVWAAEGNTTVAELSGDETPLDAGVMPLARSRVAAQALEIGAQVGGRLVAHALIFFERLRHDAIELRRLASS
jgi:hypothetical protein